MDLILTEQIEKVTIIRMIYEKKKNSLDKNFREELKQKLNAFGSDDYSRVAILTGTQNIFSSGGSLTELSDGMTAFSGLTYMKENSDIIRIIANLEKPVIAAINGVAIGAGVSIALACDLSIASSQAVFSLGFNKVGLVPDLGCTYFLPRLIGLQKTRALLFTGGSFNAEEALKMGIIGQMTAPNELMSITLGVAKEIACGPPKSIALCKSLMLKSMHLSLDEVLSYEGFSQSLCFQSSDHKEGINSFFEKRPANFSGE